MSYVTWSMTGNEFLRRIKRLGRQRGIAVRFDQRHGKGSHGTLHYGSRKTTLKDLRKEKSAPVCCTPCWASSGSAGAI